MEFLLIGDSRSIFTCDECRSTLLVVLEFVVISGAVSSWGLEREEGFPFWRFATVRSRLQEIDEFINYFNFNIMKM